MKRQLRALVKFINWAFGIKPKVDPKVAKYNEKVSDTNQKLAHLKVMKDYLTAQGLSKREVRRKVGREAERIGLKIGF
jgi:hypothetical protein